MSPVSYSISDLEQEELTLVLGSFTEEDAWLVGSSLAARALREAWPVAIDIRRPDYPLFRAAFAGSTADQSAWIDRKAATAFRFQASSLLVGMRMGSTDNDPFTSGWLDPARYTLSGGRSLSGSPAGESLPPLPCPGSPPKRIMLLLWTRCASTAATNKGPLEWAGAIFASGAGMVPPAGTCALRAATAPGPHHGSRSARATGRRSPAPGRSSRRS